MPDRKPFLALILICLCASKNALSQAADRVRFDQDVRPILSNHCWNCHGPDEKTREGNLRLDLKESAFTPGDSGKPAIVVGQPSQSQLIARIDSHDADTQMPPASFKKPLSDRQKAILRQWVSEGAEFATHWAFESPERPAVPTVKNSTWAKNEIDAFVLHRLEHEKLQPSPAADPNIWLRRVTLDLTGLPPSLEELEDFEQQLKDSSQDAAYQRVVDRLLASSRYGERMAMHWLDAARYADTNGYNNDETRTMWPWRDWVIRAFASGMPYDQFLTEQLAGDLLPDPTIDQQVATGFSRNHVLTTEGGIIEEEYHVEYVADRVHTTSTVFLAMSMQCARCHDHKYDPISQRDYYEFASFFNNVPDRVVSYNKARMAEPLLKVPSPEQTAALEALTAREVELQSLLKARASDVDADLVAWEKNLTPEQMASAGPAGLHSHFAFDEAGGENVANQVMAEQPGRVVGSATRVPGRASGTATVNHALMLDGSNYIDAGQVGIFDHTDKFSFAVWLQLSSADPSTVLSKIDEANAYRGYDLIMEGGKVAAHFVNVWPTKAFKVVSKNTISLNEWHHVVITYDGSMRATGVKIYVDGTPQEFETTTDNELSGTLKTDKPFHIGRRQNSASFKGLIDDVQVFATTLSADEAASLAKGDSIGQLAAIFSTPGAERSESQRDQLRHHYLNHVDPKSKEWRTELAELPKQRDEIDKAIPATMVMEEPKEPRPAFILKRGQYDQRGEQVESGFPRALSSAFKATSTEQTPKRSRLDLARWMTDPRHPLTSRVAVNRWWELLFGTGLVETSEDFGIQGSLPSHPELLDWLATELVRQKWDQRAILKQIVLSATYRQSSHVTPELLERDPRNVLLTRGPRYRLPAETVRDAALFVSGLYKERIGGPSVMPYQPEGLWEDVSVERRDKYVPDEGDGLYRRSMYTFWKRTCPPPGMATFDAPDRETCLVRRARTNTPLQALVLLNDPTFVEAARKLAERSVQKSGTSDERLDHAFRLVLCRRPDAAERAELKQLLSQAQKEFDADPDAAKDLLSIGKSARDATLSESELAAWTTVMSVLLNLDESISKP